MSRLLELACDVFVSVFECKNGCLKNFEGQICVNFSCCIDKTLVRQIALTLEQTIDVRATYLLQ
jgi:hypothetical protein